MVTSATLQSADTVVELGPGTGAFTRVIQDTIVPSTTFFALEINEGFATNIRRRFPDLTVHHDSAAELPKYLAQHGKSEVDCVLSGLPWASLPMDVQEGTMTAVSESLRPGGTFATFAYVHAVYLPKARRFRRRLESLFTTVEISPVVWLNLPPAFVYQCTK